MYRSNEVNWNSKLNSFDRELLAALQDAGVSGDNLVCAALATEFGDNNAMINFVEKFGHITGFNKSSVSRLATICQMFHYDATNGPDGDGESKGLRRHWYAWFKTTFAQEFSNQLAKAGDKKEITGFDGTGWAARLSTVYSALVDTEDVTYQDLWVSDTSRMTKSFYDDLFHQSHIILAVEKDSLFSDFETAAKAIGAKVLVSGKGKMSKAATELVLRKHFNWRAYSDPFTADKPLIVLSLTDWDYDGEAVIAPTFAEQCRRYTPHVIEQRIGITADQGIAGNGPLFEAKMNNSSYQEWASNNGVFELECASCGAKWLHVGTEDGQCPDCGASVYFFMATSAKDVKRGDKPAYGFEVEALRTRAYYTLIVDALLKAIDFTDLISWLRDECIANEYQAARQIWREVEQSNATLIKLNETIEKLQAYRDQFEDEVTGYFQAQGAPHTEDFRDLEEDPAVEDFKNYVAKAQNYVNVWRPFSPNVRTQALVEFLHDECADQVDWFKGLNIFKEYRNR